MSSRSNRVPPHTTDDGTSDTYHIPSSTARTGVQRTSSRSSLSTPKAHHSPSHSDPYSNRHIPTSPHQFQTPSRIPPPTSDRVLRSSMGRTTPNVASGYATPNMASGYAECSIPDPPPPVRLTGAQEYPSTSTSSRSLRPMSAPMARSGSNLTAPIMAAWDAVGSRLSMHWSRGPKTSREVVVQLEQLLLWHDVWTSVKVMVGGVYVFMCLRQLLHGRTVQLHPWTLLCAGCFLLLVYNSLCNVWAQLRHSWHLARNQVDPPPPLPASQRSPEAELKLQHDITHNMVKAAEWLAPYAGAVAVLARRALAGERAGATAWTGLSLWLLMLVSELRLLSASSNAMLLWIMMFTLPPLYVQSRQVMDSLVHELWDFILWGFTDSRHRLTLIMAGAAGWVVVACLPGGLVLRLTLAAAAYCGVLAWRASTMAAGDSGERATDARRQTIEHAR